MSISFNHPNNTVTSTDSLTFNTTGGTVLVPKPIRLNSSSVIMPVVEEPRGETGAIIYDRTKGVMKYHNGIEWIEWASKPDIIDQIEISLKDIYEKLDTKIDTVTYSSSTIPTASISGTTLNIVFPTASDGITETAGLYTSLPRGSITYYSMSSGQNFASIREQMGGQSGIQNGRDGSQANPFITETGWCLADGKYWKWKGSTGDVIIQTPNLNQNNYLKSITENSGTNTNNIVLQSGTVSSTTINFPDHYHGVAMMMSENDRTNADDVSLIYGRTFPGSYNGVLVCGDQNKGRIVKPVYGSNPNTAITTTNSVSTGGSNLSNTHAHNISNLEMQHFKVAVLYNISLPERALNEGDGDKRYVRKTGDVMTGSLEIANSMTLAGSSTLLQIPFKNSAGTELSNIYVDSRDSSINLRAGIKDILKVAPNGKLTFNGNALVQKINGQVPDVNGNVDVAGIPIGAVVMWFQTTPPPDFIEVNGRFNVNQWPKLAKIYPDGVIPDMRGAFPRGWDNGRGLDSGRGIRSYQDDAIQDHRHNQGTESKALGGPKLPAGNWNGGFGNYNGNPATHGVISENNVKLANETRPKNVSVMFIMRAN